MEDREAADDADLTKDIKKKNILSALFPLILTVVIFTVILMKINIGEFIIQFHSIDIPVLIFSLSLLIPAIILIAVRWKLMIGRYKDITISEGIRVTLVSQSLNIITPSKLGDFAKAYFLRDKRFNLKIGTGAAVLEKIIDLFTILIYSILGMIFLQVALDNSLIIIIVLAFLMLILMVLGILLDFGLGSPIHNLFIRAIPFKRLKVLISDMLLYFTSMKRNKRSIALISLITALIWLIHIFQAYLFFRAVGIDIDFFLVLGLVPIGIIIGMIPLTIAGMGTRDTAFLVLFSGYAPASSILLFSIIFSSKYIILSLTGLPWLNRYLRKGR